jgi:hypothetical protein
MFFIRSDEDFEVLFLFSRKPWKAILLLYPVFKMNTRSGPPEWKGFTKEQNLRILAKCSIVVFFDRLRMLDFRKRLRKILDGPFTFY